MSINTVLDISKVNASNFEVMALSVFRHQYETNEVYRNYCNSLGKSIDNIYSPEQIPFLPIRFFKSHIVTSSGNWNPAVIFESSGTTGSIPSRHFIKDLSIYEESFLRSFEWAYGSPKKYCILGLQIGRAHV